MLFVGSPKGYSYDTKEDLKVGEQYTSSNAYPGKVLEVKEIFPKDESIKLPYQIKSIVVGPVPEIPVANTVYVTKI